jgi:hypothetical protein
VFRKRASVLIAIFFPLSRLLFVLLVLSVGSPISYLDLSQPAPFAISKSLDSSTWTFLGFSIETPSFLTLRVRRNSLQGCLSPGIVLFRGRPADSFGLSPTASTNPAATFIRHASPSGAFGTATLEAALALSGNYVVAVWGETGVCSLGAAVVAGYEFLPMTNVINCTSLPPGVSRSKCSQFVTSIIEQTVASSKRGVPVPIVVAPLATALGQPLTLPNSGVAYPQQWQYFGFSGQAGSVVTLRVARREPCVDPAAALFQGTPGSTLGLSAFSSARSDAQWLSFADDEIPPAFVGGPMRDVQLSIVLPATGNYTLAIFAYNSTCASAGIAALTQFVVAASAPCSIELDLDSVVPEGALSPLQAALTEPGFASLDASLGQESSTQVAGARFVVEVAGACRVRTSGSYSWLLADGCTSAGFAATVTIAAYGLLPGNYTATFYVFDPEVDSGTITVSAFGRQTMFTPSSSTPTAVIAQATHSMGSPARFTAQTASVARYVRLAGLRLERLDVEPPQLLCNGPLQVVADNACLATVPAWNPIFFDNCDESSNFLALNGELEALNVSDPSGVQTFLSVPGWSSPLTVAREIQAQTPLNPLGKPTGNSAVLTGGVPLVVSFFVPPDVSAVVLDLDVLADAPGRFVSVTARNAGGLIVASDSMVATSQSAWKTLSYRLAGNVGGQLVTVEVASAGTLASDPVQGRVNRVRARPGPEIVSQSQSDLNVGSLVFAGNYTVVFRFTDAAGLNATCTLLIQVMDVTAPLVLSCPTAGTVTVVADPRTCSATASWSDPIVSDNCGFVLEYIANGQLVQSGGRFPVGLTTVMAVARDATGRTALCEFNVSVVDVEPPVLGLEALPSMSLPCGAGYESIWKGQGAHACVLDNCPSSLVFASSFLQEPTCGVATSASAVFTVLDANDPASPPLLVGPSTFELHDGTCTSTPELELDIQVTPPPCYGSVGGGSARVRAIKANGVEVPNFEDYAFVWSNGVNASLSRSASLENVSYGVYRVTASLQEGSRKRLGPLGPVVPCDGLCGLKPPPPYVPVGVACVHVPVSAPLEVSLSTALSCQNRAEAIVSGGTPPYRYQWTDGSTARESNVVGSVVVSLSVVVEDANGCTSSAAGPVLYGPGLAVTVLTIGPSSFTASATGGSPGYSFVWSPGGVTSQSIVGPVGSNFIVTATDTRGCTARASTDSGAFPIPPGGDLLSSAGIDSILYVPLSVHASTVCGGVGLDSLKAIGVGGTPPYTFLWKNNVSGDTLANPVPGQEYRLRVTDSRNAQVETRVRAGLLPGLEIDSVGCLNGAGAIRLRVLGEAVSPLRFAWSNGQSTSLPQLLSLPPVREAYSVILTDGRGCQASLNPIFTLASCTSLGACFQCGVSGTLHYCCASGGLNFVACSTSGERFCTRSVSCASAVACRSDSDCGPSSRCMQQGCCGAGPVCAPEELACDVARRQEENQGTLCHIRNSTTCVV